MRKATKKLLMYGINMIILLSTMLVGVWAVADPSFGFQVTVTYEQSITGKVYIATSGIGNTKFEQPDATIGTFKLGGNDSALIMDSTVASPILQVADFNALGNLNEGDGLLVETGVIEFYVFVQNYNRGSNLYYKANVTLDKGDDSPFEVTLGTDSQGPLVAATENEEGEIVPKNGFFVIRLEIKQNNGETVQVDSVSIQIVLSATAIWLEIKNLI